MPVAGHCVALPVGAPDGATIYHTPRRGGIQQEEQSAVKRTLRVRIETDTVWIIRAPRSAVRAWREQHATTFDVVEGKHAETLYPGSLVLIRRWLRTSWIHITGVREKAVQSYLRSLHEKLHK
jgi:hypothetical protein